MKVEIMPVEPVHVIGLIERTQFASIRGARESLRTHILLSENAWVAKLDGVTVATWGVIPPNILSSQVYVWAIVADAIAEDPFNKFLFARYSQRIAEILLAKYESLYGFCYPSQVASIKWLKFLGAKFEEPREDGRMLFRIGRK
jgi:hypothetical protein